MQFVEDAVVVRGGLRLAARSGKRRVAMLLGASVLVTAGVALAQAPAPAPAPIQTPAPVAVPSMGPARIAPVPGAGPAPLLSEGVATVVNNDIISTYDLRQRMLLLIISSGVRPTQESLPALQREALSALIDESVQMQEIRRIERDRGVNLQPSDAEITEEVNALAAQNNITGAQLLASLAAAGVDPQTLREQLRSQMSWQRYMGGAFGGRITIGEDEINNTLQRVSAAAAKQQFLLAEIFVDNQRAGGAPAALEGARQLVEQIRGGAPFAGVARQFSSAATAASGGDAGWVVSGDVPPEVEKALEALRPGQLSDPIPTAGGVYVVLLRDKSSGSDATLVDLKQAAIRLAADAPETERVAASERLTALKGQLDSCETFEAKAGAVQGVVAGNLGETDVNDLSPAFREAIGGLQPGQVGGPVRSDAGMHLIALCGRRAGGANAPTRDAIRQRLMAQELAMIAKRELRDLRNSANIENK